MEGLSNCYVFKSRLQEYTQKVGIPAPVYDIHKQGPSHLPSFTAIVTVDNTKYASLPGFPNHKLAELSAAEIALIELSMSGNTIPTPVYEIGLCKNMLQQYALKMNHAVPVYTCSESDVPGKGVQFTCTVDVGGVKYVGGLATKKKEAIRKAARTALLAINGVPCDDSETLRLMVIPTKRKEAENPPKVKGSPAKEPSKKESKKKRIRALQATATVAEEHNKQSGALNSSLVEIQLPEHAKGNDLTSMSYLDGQNDSTVPVSFEVAVVVEAENPPKVKDSPAKKSRKKVDKRQRKRGLQSTATVAEEHNKQSEVVNSSLVEIKPSENVKGNDLISMSYSDGQKDPSALVISEVAAVVEAENLPKVKDSPEKEQSKKVNKKKRKRAQATVTVAEEHNKQTEALNSSIAEISEHVKGNDLISMSYSDGQKDSYALVSSEVAAVVEAEKLPKCKDIPEKEQCKKASKRKRKRGKQARATSAEDRKKQTEAFNSSIVAENAKRNDLISMSHLEGQKDSSALVISEVAAVVGAENLPKVKDSPEKEPSKKGLQATAAVYEEYNKQPEALNSSIVEIPENVKGNDLFSMSLSRGQNDSSALIISEVAAVVEAENLPKVKDSPEKEPRKQGLQATSAVSEEYNKQPESLNSSLVEIQLPENVKGNDLIFRSCLDGQNDSSAPISSEVAAVVDIKG